MSAATLEAVALAWPSASEDRRRAALDALRGAAALDAGPGRALNLSEAARRAGVSRDAVYRAVKAGVLRRSPLHDGGRQWITEADLDRWMHAGFLSEVEAACARLRAFGAQSALEARPPAEG